MEERVGEGWRRGWEKDGGEGGWEKSNGCDQQQQEAAAEAAAACIPYAGLSVIVPW
jgi:hypothetical protein